MAITEQDRIAASEWLSDPDNAYDIWVDDMLTEQEEIIEDDIESEYEREVLSMYD
jgi:hypothetical protein